MALTVPIALTSCSDDDNALTPSQQQDIELVELTEQYLNATVIPTYTLLANGTSHNSFGFCTEGSGAYQMV